MRLPGRFKPMDIGHSDHAKAKANPYLENL